MKTFAVFHVDQCALAALMGVTADDMLDKRLRIITRPSTRAWRPLLAINCWRSGPAGTLREDEAVTRQRRAIAAAARKLLPAGASAAASFRLPLPSQQQASAALVPV
jgi:hypothetical protein